MCRRPGNNSVFERNGNAADSITSAAFPFCNCILHQTLPVAVLRYLWNGREHYSGELICRLPHSHRHAIRNNTSKAIQAQKNGYKDIQHTHARGRGIMGWSKQCACACCCAEETNGLAATLHCTSAPARHSYSYSNWVRCAGSYKHEHSQQTRALLQRCTAWGAHTPARSETAAPMQQRYSTSRGAHPPPAAPELRDPSRKPPLP